VQVQAQAQTQAQVPHIPYAMDQIWTFNLVYIYDIWHMAYADWSFCSTYNVFSFYALGTGGVGVGAELGADRVARIASHAAAVKARVDKVGF
jgi:hypothetical protein